VFKRIKYCFLILIGRPTLGMMLNKEGTFDILVSSNKKDATRLMAAFGLHSVSVDGLSDEQIKELEIGFGSKYDV